VLAIAAFLMLGCHVGAYSLIQNSITTEMRGRVISVNVSVSIGGPALGALLIGWLAEAIGLQWAVVSSAMLALAIMLCLLPSVRRSAPEMEAE
jgi:MFS family permease